jgi:hypothetical protein
MLTKVLVAASTAALAHSTLSRGRITAARRYGWRNPNPV